MMVFNSEYRCIPPLLEGGVSEERTGARSLPVSGCARLGWFGERTGASPLCAIGMVSEEAHAEVFFSRQLVGGSVAQAVPGGQLRHSSADPRRSVGYRAGRASRAPLCR